MRVLAELDPVSSGLKTISLPTDSPIGSEFERSLESRYHRHLCQ